LVDRKQPHPSQKKRRGGEKRKKGDKRLQVQLPTTLETHKFDFMSTGHRNQSSLRGHATKKIFKFTGDSGMHGWVCHPGSGLKKGSEIVDSSTTMPVGKRTEKRRLGVQQHLPRALFVVFIRLVSGRIKQIWGGQKKKSKALGRGYLQGVFPVVDVVRKEDIQRV